MGRAYHDLTVYGYLLKNPGDGSVFDHHAFRTLVSKAAAEAEKVRNPFAFVLMPFADEYKSLYENVIKATVERLGFACRRADDFFEAKPIMDDVCAGIDNAVFNIADFSGKNPNVFYEVGLAHATQRSTLLISQSIDCVPEYLRQVRHILYDNSLPGGRKLQKDLETAIQRLTSEDTTNQPLFQPGNSEIAANSCLVLTPADDTESETAYTEIIEPAADQFGLSCVNAHSIFSTESRLKEVWKRVEQASLVIADLSTKDADAFYLTGFAHGLGKRVLLLARDKRDVPFDLRDRSCIEYSIEPYSAGEQSIKLLVLHLQSLLKKAPQQKMEKIRRLLEEHDLQSTLQELLETPGLLYEESKVGLEKIIGVNNLKQIAWLERGLKVADSVCRVIVEGGGFGSGFLIAPDLIMTNNHVIPNKDVAAKSWVEFNYELRLDQKEKLTQRYRLDSLRFHTSSALDYTIVGVVAEPDKAPLSQWGHLTLNPNADPVVGEHVSIIQHPNGGPKQIVLTANQVIGKWDHRLHYTTDTMPGSSGSPVFNDSWEVIAIHHEGGNLQVNAKGDKRFINEGVLMSAIKPDAGDFWAGS